MMIKMETRKITMQTRKLNATWTREMTKDLRTMYGVDVGKDLDDAVRKEVELELAREKRELRLKKLGRILDDINEN